MVETVYRCDMRRVYAHVYVGSWMWFMGAGKKKNGGRL